MTFESWRVTERINRPADEDGSEVVFTVRRRAGLTDDQFKADGDAVAADRSGPAQAHPRGVTHVGGPSA